MSEDFRRIEATKRVMKALARLVAHQPLPVRREDGSSPLVVTFPEESVSDMIARLRRSGGTANVVVDYEDRFVVAALSSGSFSATEGDVADVHHLSNVGMLVSWLQAQPDGEAFFRMRGNAAEVAERPRIEEHEYQF